MIVNPRAEAVIEGKFAYSRVNKDLEDEDAISIAGVFLTRLRKDAPS